RNAKSQSSYTVVIRGSKLGDNSCTCGDFTTNTLGTCKHIECTLAHLEQKRGGKSALEQGFQHAYSEIYLRFGKQREVCFRPGADCPAELARLAQAHFYDEGTLQPDAITTFDDFLEQARAIDPDLRVRDVVLRWLAEKRDLVRREEILQREYPRG